MKSYWQHKTKPEVFGVLETRGNGKVKFFKKWRYEIINQNKPAPKFTSRLVGDNLKFREQLEKGIVKEIDPDFYNHFKEISYSEFCVLDMIEWIKT